MADNYDTFLSFCVRLMIRPLAIFCVSRGLRIQDFIHLAKEEFVRSAHEGLQKESASISISRLSVMTGLQRPEINRILENPADRHSKDFITRIIGQWTSDKQFKAGGRLRQLGVEGLNSDFAKLVASVSKDLNPHTVRFELERLKVVTIKNGKAKLMTPVYNTTGDAKSTFRFGSQDVADLLYSIQENAFVSNEIPNLQARTEYDNIPNEDLPAIRKWLLDAGTTFHENARHYLSKFDRDINGVNSKGSGRNRIVVGTYSRVETESK